MSSSVYPWDAFRQDQDFDPSLCFIMSPLREEFAGPKQIIEEVCVELGCRCVRADDITRPGIIHADIWKHVQQAAIIVADTTDLNPNVILEVGVASAVKEQFRLILMIRDKTSAPLPFDLSPFRHIRYQDSLTGSRELRTQLREAMRYALSEGAELSSIEGRMETWKRAHRDYSLLLPPDAVARAKGFASLGTTSSEVKAYIMASAAQHGSSVEFWARLNSDNVLAAEVLVELLLGPWLRPQFRAAFALQFMNATLRSAATQEAYRLSPQPLIKALADAVESEGVLSFVQSASREMMNESDRYELLVNFTPRMSVRLSSA